MNLQNKYKNLLALTCLGILLALPSFYSRFPNLVFAIEEIIGVGLFILGIWVFHPLVKFVLKKLYKHASIPFNKRKHILIILITTLLFSCALSFILFCIVWTYQYQFGVPEFHQIKEQLLNIELDKYESGQHVPPWFYIPPFTASMYFLPFLGGSILLFLSLFSIEEYLRYNQSIQEAELKKDQEAKELALSKVQAIQNQLNPHFMFNTLNVLSGLMHEDLKRADIFIEKLSSIYRYVLLQSEEIVSTLEKEIEFTQAYIYLLKIRFDDKLYVNIDIDKNKLGNLIPSLTLELLIENAIKHNSLDSENPIKIDIYIEEENLVVKNNISPRMDKTNSLGIGIKNLKKRLSALGINTASFGATKEHYIAKVPLIKSI